jgi:hypothetical protein
MYGLRTRIEFVARLRTVRLARDETGFASEL